MDDAEGLAVLIRLGMGVREPARDAAGDEDRQFLGQLTVLIAQLPGELLKVHAPDQFHADETDAFGFAQMIGLDDIGMDQVGNELGLANEVLDEHLLAGVVGTDDLNSNAFNEVAGAMLLGFENNTHTALKNFADNLVAKVTLNGEQRHTFIVRN